MRRVHCQPVPLDVTSIRHRNSSEQAWQQLAPAFRVSSFAKKKNVTECNQPNPKLNQILISSCSCCLCRYRRRLHFWQFDDQLCSKSIAESSTVQLCRLGFCIVGSLGSILLYGGASDAVWTVKMRIIFVVVVVLDRNTHNIIVLV